jgi:hypothetical protein
VQQSAGINGLASISATLGDMVRKPQTTRRARPPARPRRARKPDTIDALVAASAQALALPIDPAWHGGIRLNLQLILTHAALVDEFSLADETEPAPVFSA